MTQIKSQTDLYTQFVTELQSQAQDLTDTNDGSIIDVIAGVTSSAVNEILALTLDLFRKTYFSTANGPEITLGPDDLQTLAVDHFGDSFARPQAVKATGTVQLTRPNADAGNVTIPVGAIVKTPPNSSGVSQRYEVTAEVILVGTSINASVRALVAGIDGNALIGTVTAIETTLTDPSVVVNNAAAFAGGEPTETDAQYRETIRYLLETLRGATAAAITAQALIVGGVQTATTVEFLQYVKEWDIAGNAPIGTYFPIPRARLYVADANGTASNTLLDDVRTSIELTRACGVYVEVLAGEALLLDWTALLTLDPGGPNYATLQTDASMIEDTMLTYIQEIPIGTTFVRADANAAMLALWGPAGTGDLTNFVTTAPVGNVEPDIQQKFIPGEIST